MKYKCTIKFNCYLHNINGYFFHLPYTVIESWSLLVESCKKHVEKTAFFYLERHIYKD